MENGNFSFEVGLALARGDRALWIGPESLPLTGASRQLFTDQQWLGVWAESRQAEAARSLEISWRERSAARMMVEVPDLVEDALGEHFKFSDFCPYFYLNGKGAGADMLRPLPPEHTHPAKPQYFDPLGPHL